MADDGAGPSGEGRVDALGSRVTRSGNRSGLSREAGDLSGLGRGRLAPRHSCTGDRTRALTSQWHRTADDAIGVRRRQARLRRDSDLR